MKKRVLSFITLLLLFAFTACSNKSANVTSVTTSDNVGEIKTADAKLMHNLTLLVTSDIHVGFNDNWTLAGLYEKREEYEDSGNYTLLVDCGDMVQGGLLSSVSKGMDIVDIANTMGYDVMTMGNHEFDYGMGQFRTNAAKLNNQYISCNFNNNGKLVFKPYVIKQFDGVRFAFVGINTPDTLTTSTPKYFQDANGKFIYGFFEGNNGETLYRKVQEAIDGAKAEGLRNCCSTYWK